MLRETSHFRIRERFLGEWLGGEENCIMQTFKINTVYFSPNNWANNTRGKNERVVQNISG
jgi:hypothetical protein